MGVLPHKVTVYERTEKGGVLYLKWRHAGNWQKESLGRRLRDDAGVVDELVWQWAVAQATERYNALVAGLPRGVKAPPPVAEAPLTIGETATVITNPDTGMYRVDTDYRREVLRELKTAALVWGPDTPWAHINAERITELASRRLRQLLKKGKVGVRGTEVTVSRVLTVAAWLREKEKIPATAAIAPRRWQKELHRHWRELQHVASGDVPVSRPRHTLEELQKILQAALTYEDDPRFALLFVLGAELRLGQVRRCRRSHLDLTIRYDEKGEVASYGLLRVPGVGSKKGTVVDLTRGQRAVIDAALGGWLGSRELQYQAEGLDYFLFPAGKIRRQRLPAGELLRITGAVPVSRKWVRDHFLEVEQRAGVKNVSGRNAYGARRIAVDTANDMKLSAKGLQALGGWTNSRIPNEVYAEQENIAGRAEARLVRERLRGEAAAAPAAPASEANSGTDSGTSRTPDVPHNTDAPGPEGPRGAEGDR